MSEPQLPAALPSPRERIQAILNNRKLRPYLFGGFGLFLILLSALMSGNLTFENVAHALEVVMAVTGFLIIAGTAMYGLGVLIMKLTNQTGGSQIASPPQPIDNYTETKAFGSADLTDAQALHDVLSGNADDGSRWKFEE